MNCQNCGKELSGRKGKKYCNKQCSTEFFNKKIHYISIRLSPENLEKVLILEKQLLKEQFLEEDK